MKRMALICMALGLGNLWWVTAQEPPPQQRELPPEIKRMREEMFRGLPPDVRKMFEEAFDESFFESEGLPEGTPPGKGLPFDPFGGRLPRELRRSPEMNELRNRQIDRNEKLSSRNLATFAPLLKSYHQSVLKITNEAGEQLAFATCVDPSGLLVTKASQLAEMSELQAKQGNKTFAARVVNVNERYDLALLHIDADHLTAVTWADDAPTIGTLLVAGDDQGAPFTTGVVSVGARPLIDQGRAFLGVEPITVANGVLVNSVSRGQAAEAAGLLMGDIITQLDGQPTTTSHKFANDIRLKRPGDKIDLVVLRDDKEIALNVELKGINAGGMQFFNQEMGAELNSRMSDFDLVFQHDAQLWPEQCGGPIIDLNGQVVGFNIARSGRVRSYAIPSGKMKELVQALIATAKTSS